MPLANPNTGVPFLGRQWWPVAIEMLLRLCSWSRPRARRARRHMLQVCTTCCNDLGSSCVAVSVCHTSLGVRTRILDHQSASSCSASDPTLLYTLVSIHSFIQL
uniref:Uncharacterized protein n=1 Tax=Arundo donax TaxID=35708 RepID=A0A0A8YBW1_ARUDO